jgi:hypothetical protein
MPDGLKTRETKVCACGRKVTADRRKNVSENATKGDEVLEVTGHIESFRTRLSQCSADTLYFLDVEFSVTTIYSLLNPISRHINKILAYFSEQSH